MRSSSEWKVTTTSRPPGARRALGRFEAAQQLAEFVVDGDAQRLEGARRRMGRFARPRRRDAGDHLGELQRRDIGRRLAVGDDGARDAPRGALLAEMKEDVGDRRFVVFAQDVGGAAARRLPCACRAARRGAARSRARPRRAASRRRRCRATTPSSGATPQPRAIASRSPKRPSTSVRRPREAGDERRAGGDRGGIAIDRDDARAALEQRARIAARAERAVEIDAAGARRSARRALSASSTGMWRAGPPAATSFSPRPAFIPVLLRGGLRRRAPNSARKPPHASLGLLEMRREP